MREDDKMMDVIKKVADYAQKTITIISSIFMLLLVTVVFFEVACRNIFNYPITVTSELTTVLFPWLVFLGAILVTKNSDHIAISVFVDHFPKPLKKTSIIFAKLVMLIFSLFMIASSVLLTESVMDYRLNILHISKAWLYSSVIICFIGIAIVLVYQIHHYIRYGEEAVVENNNGEEENK